MKTIKDKIKQYPHMKIVSDNGFQAITLTNNFNNNGKRVNAIIIYDNNGNGDGKYGKPSQVIYGSAYFDLKDAMEGVFWNIEGDNK